MKRNVTDFSISDGYQFLEDLAKLKESDEIGSHVIIAST